MKLIGTLCFITAGWVIAQEPAGDFRWDYFLGAFGLCLVGHAFLEGWKNR